MALKTDNLIVGVPPIDSPTPDTKLTKEEIEVILNMVKQTTFQGSAIEPLYKLIVKLQNQYLEQ